MKNLAAFLLLCLFSSNVVSESFSCSKTVSIVDKVTYVSSKHGVVGGGGWDEYFYSANDAIDFDITNSIFSVGTLEAGSFKVSKKNDKYRGKFSKEWVVANSTTMNFGFDSRTDKLQVFANYIVIKQDKSGNWVGKSRIDVKSSSVFGRFPDWTIREHYRFREKAEYVCEVM